MRIALRLAAALRHPDLAVAEDGTHEPMPGLRPPSIEETALGLDAEELEHAPLRRGASVGRYVLLDQVGAGAMGVVFSAYDPELDRRLALKVLHAGSSTREAKATHNRLRREAQALARLTHPNVVTVHDVGTHRGRVFVAMEFVAGRTLRQWLSHNPRSPPTVAEIIKVFAAAGRGLAAAHKAGLVHRDFKPENVLLGDDQIVRVVDFGLARRSEEESLVDGESLDNSGTVALDAKESERLNITAERSLEMSLTRTGGMMGTPAYMAPEQHLGETATPRSDQFAFCVALWEALYGQRPFPGRDLPSLSLAVTTGRFAEPPSDGPFANRVPAHVHRALLRGLSTEPSNRFANMEALVKALTHDPGRRRRRIATIVAVNLVGASVVFGAGMWFAEHFAGAEAELAVCEPERELGSIWDAQRRAKLAERFASSNAPFAAHSARALDRRLQGYTRQWLDAWSETCEAERTLGPSETLELQRECLDQRRRELVAFTEALVNAEGEAFDQRAEFAVAAAEGLPAISTCRDPSRLRADQHRNPEQRERVATLQTQLSEARALGTLGDPKTGLERATRVVAEARELDSQRTLIRALLLVASLQKSANEQDAAVAHLREAYAIAEQHGEDWLRAEAAVALIGLLGFDLQRPDQAAVWQHVAGSLLDRIGDPDDLRGQWWYHVGTVHARQSNFPEAEQALDRALAQLEAVHGQSARELEPTLLQLGSVARERGDYERAVAYHSRMLERRKAAYGPDHPDVAAVYGSLGTDAYFRGDYEEARDYYKEALRIVGECYGEDSPAYAFKLNNYAAVLERLGQLDEAEAMHRQLLSSNIARYGGRDVRVTTSYENLGLVLLSANRFAEAAEQFRTSLDIRIAHHGEDHTATATSKLNLGYALFRLDDRKQARALYEQALASWTAKLGEDHPDLGLAHGNLGELDFAEGKLADARAHYDRALALTSAALGEEAADLGYYLTGLAKVALAEGDHDEAIELGERALQLRNGTWLPPGDLGETQLTLSRAFVSRGRSSDRTRAKDLAALAIEDIRRGPDVGRLAEAKAWLASLD
jgi:tetratricopeptide (TPR) repeat protein/tRNA A-37 threonylcarbamoyl transferase component Bud32